LSTPRGKKEKARIKEKEFNRKTKKVFLSSFLRDKASGKFAGIAESSRTKVAVRVAIMVGAIAVTGVVCYMLVFSYWESKEVDPVAAMKAMNTLRELPSNQEGFTVDQLMNEELERFRKSGNLKGHQGWHTRKIRGTESRVLVVFSFKDNEDRDHRAEWMVEVNKHIVVPQTELATTVYNK
jgi:hypothetical protein